MEKNKGRKLVVKICMIVLFLLIAVLGDLRGNVPGRQHADPVRPEPEAGFLGCQF